MKRTVIASGYFNPLHRGHLEYLTQAKALAKGGSLWVIVNTDAQVALKGSVPFQGESERLAIVAALRVVDLAILAIDTDATVCKTITWVIERIPPLETVIFAKGGDRHAGDIPEAATCRDLGVRIVDGLGPKVASSSDLTRPVATLARILRRLQTTCTYDPLRLEDMAREGLKEVPSWYLT